MNMDITEYVKEEALVIIYVLYILGAFLKQADFLNNKFIPIVLVFMGIVMALGLLGLSFGSAVQGVLCAGGAVLTNEVITQAKK